MSVSRGIGLALIRVWGRSLIAESSNHALRVSAYMCDGPSVYLIALRVQSGELETFLDIISRGVGRLTYQSPNVRSGIP